MAETDDKTGMSRQDFLRAAGMGAGALALGNYGLAIAAGDAGWTESRTGAVSYRLTPLATSVDLGNRRVPTIAYDGLLPGPEIRLTKGKTLHALVRNRLHEDTSVHWHGIPIPNKMDGVPGVTQAPIKPGTDYHYRFRVPVSGTYWYHSHSGLQMDRGLYGPLIIDDPYETLKYDHDVSLMFDDWHDGYRLAATDRTNTLYECRLDSVEAGALPSRDHTLIEPVVYPAYLVNGRSATTPFEITVKRGDVARLRLINPSSATTYRIAIAGHRMRVTHADGLAVIPVDVDVLEMGMGERYDVLVHANNPGAWQIAAQAVGKGRMTRAVLRYAGSVAANPPAKWQPKELRGRMLSYNMLRPGPGVPVPGRRPDVTIRVTLNNSFGSFWLAINDQVVADNQTVHIPRGKHIRFQLTNSTVQIHPIHLHGHSFQVGTPSGHGPMKDTAMVPAFKSMTFDWIADNPGIWMLHCHNLYHMHAGMMVLLQVS